MTLIHNPGNDSINENAILENTAQKAEAYFAKYKPYMESLEKNSLLSKVRPIREGDYACLGEQLQQWSDYRKWAENDGTFADLVAFPNLMFDVITLNYGQNPIGIMASMQTIENEQGIIYFKKVVSRSTSGNITSGQTLQSVQFGMPEVPQQFSGSNASNESFGTPNGVDTSFTYTVARLPVQPNSVRIAAVISAEAATAFDEDNGDGTGNILGAHIVPGSTINYTTGVLDIEFDVAPDDGAATTLTVSYHQNLEKQTNINTIDSTLSQLAVKANTYALRSDLGMFKNYAYRKVYGRQMEQEMVEDLLNQLNAEICGRYITLLAAAPAQTGIGTVSFDTTVPDGISEYAHRKSMQYKLLECERNLAALCGRGTISFIVAGRNICMYLASMDGFQLIYEGASVSGAHLYGTWKGVPIIRVPQDTTILDADTALPCYKGTGRFEAPGYYATFMPMVVTDMLPMQNPLVRQRAAATWAAIGLSVPQFVTKLVITA
jgi:hypothetical protein